MPSAPSSSDCAVRLFERLGLDPLDVHLQPVREAAVIERFVEALVGILVADVLADDVNGDARRPGS